MDIMNIFKEHKRLKNICHRQNQFSFKDHPIDLEKDSLEDDDKEEDQEKESKGK